MTTETILRSESVHAEPVNAFPGDRRMRLTSDAETLSGNRVSSGTMFQPQSAGMDNTLGLSVRRVIILD